MKRILSLVALALTGCTLFTDPSAPLATAVSPDGRNEIRLYLSPLAYEVVRDGTVVVAKSGIGLTVDGCPLETGAGPVRIDAKTLSGRLETPVYKKLSVDLAARETTADFGNWALRMVARDDGVAYRFEIRRPGRVRIDDELAEVVIPSADARGWTYYTKNPGCEENVAVPEKAGAIATPDNQLVYLPYVYACAGKTVALVEADVSDYPNINFARAAAPADGVKLAGVFEKMPTAFYNQEGNEGNVGGKRLRLICVSERADYLTLTEGTRTLPWRGFVLADNCARLCENDLVRALAAPAAPGADFSWVKPGKVAWEWWNAFDNKGDPEGCTTATYRRFIDFAAKNGVEYVIFDEGWSQKLNIWAYSPAVDVPALVEYANGKGVGIILWMAWAQAYGEEEKVAEFFGKLGVKGFKVDFMNRCDTDLNRFLVRFADACAKRKLLVDYHGVARPVGLERRFPNIVNFEGVHGLEQMKFYRNQDMMLNDLASYFCRMTQGPMDYTPGAMDNYPLGQYPKNDPKQAYHARKMWISPGSLGTRARQMAMMALYFAPLQMLCDSPTKYEKNAECFSFMAGVPTVWEATVGLGGDPDSYAAVARKAKDGAWYAAAINGAAARKVEVETRFLGAGVYKAEIFRDADDAAEHPVRYIHERRDVRAGEKLTLALAPGGGFIIRFTKD